MAPLVAPSTNMLEPEEESWRSVFDTLCDRFPKITPAQILEELRDADGHAGRASVALRNKAILSKQEEPEQKKPVSFAPKQEEPEQKKPVLLAPSPGTSQSISSSSRSQKQEAEKTPASHEPLRHHKRGAKAEVNNTAALAQEGMRLRRELDAAWNEANAWGQVSDDSASKDRAITIRAELSRANATAAALSNNGLRVELEASRQESGGLRREIEEALAIGSIGTPAEREQLRRDLDQTLSHRGGGAAAITERERLRVEVLEAQSEISGLHADFGVGRAAGDGKVFTPKSKSAAWRRNLNPTGRESPLHSTNDPSPIDTEEGLFIPKFSPGGRVVEVAFVPCRDDLADDEVPRKMPSRFIFPDSPTPVPAAGVKTTRSQMDRSPQPRSPQPDISAQLGRSPTQPDRSPARPAPVQASTSQCAPTDASDALHQKASAIFASIFASSPGNEAMTPPFELSPQGHDIKEPNAMYQKTGAMLGANVGAKEAVSMSRAKREGDTNTAHGSATAKFAGTVGPEVRTAQRAARKSGDDVNAMYQKAASEVFARDKAGTLQGSRDVPNAMQRKAAAVFAANAGLKAEANTDVMYQRAAAAYAASPSHLGELRTNHTRLLSKAC